MKVHFFFRKPSEKYHSIELLFDVIQKQLSTDFQTKNVYSKFYSKGFFPRLFSAIIAAFHQGDINHITGDIHFFSIFMQKARTILTIHDVEVLKRTHGMKHKLLKFFWFRFPISRVSKVTVISEFSKNELIKYLPKVQSKISVIPNCINAIFAPSEKIFNAQKPRILQMGTKHNKNIERVAEALSGIDCVLIIVGELSENQIGILRKYQIEYENYGHLSLQEIYDIYVSSDILIFASTYEGFGLPLLEAQAVGRPVICSNISSMPFVAGNAALFVDPFSVSEIRAAVKQLIKDDALRKELVYQGFDNVSRFSSKVVANLYAQEYLRLGGKSNRKNGHF